MRHRKSSPVFAPHGLFPQRIGRKAMNNSNIGLNLLLQPKRRKRLVWQDVAKGMILLFAGNF